MQYRSGKPETRQLLVEEMKVIPPSYVIPHLHRLPTDPGAQIRTYDARDAFESLNYDDQALTSDHPVEIRKQWALEAEEPEPEQKITTVSELTEGLGC